jgi:hypothetical protein
MNFLEIYLLISVLESRINNSLSDLTSHNHTQLTVVNAYDKLLIHLYSHLLVLYTIIIVSLMYLDVMRYNYLLKILLSIYTLLHYVTTFYKKLHK